VEPGQATNVLWCGVRINGTSSTITHDVNATNEITSLDVPNPAGGPALISDAFTSSLSSGWTQQGGWSIASGEVNVDTLDGELGWSELTANVDLDIINYEVEIKFPTSSSSAKAGMVLISGFGSGKYIGFNRSTGKFGIYTSHNMTTELAGVSVSISENTTYTIRVDRKEGLIAAWVEEIVSWSADFHRQEHWDGVIAE